MALALCLVAGCGGSASTTNRTSGTASTPPGSGALTLEIETRNLSQTPVQQFAEGESLVLVARFLNTLPQDAVVEARDGCGLIDHRIETRFGGRPGSLLFNSTAGQVCTQAIVPHTIPAGQPTEFTFLWDQTDNAGAALQRGNYVYRTTVREPGGDSFALAPLQIAIGSNVIEVTGTATNNGFAPSTAQASVGDHSVQISQNGRQTALATATLLANEINRDPAYNAVAARTGPDAAEIRVNLAAGVTPPYLPVVFEVRSNDPAQRVTAP
jgi:hypothetical protein